MIDFNYTILIQFFNFLILLILLNFLLFKPVLKALNKRDKTISNLFEKVDKAKEETNTCVKLYEERLRERKEPILHNKEASISQAQKHSAEIMEKARTELAEELSKIRYVVEKESMQVYENLKMDVEKLAKEIGEKVLQRSI
ncbi:MAG TPA: hypothetical protein DDW17_00770 [Deltaproteobacteria bacterium]|nr:hypothetical protein [Deltaproteobacteria bacterium]